MRPLSLWLAAALATSPLTACAPLTQSAVPSSTNAANAGAPDHPHVNASGCSTSVVYVTSYDNSIYVFDQKHNGGYPCGRITGLTNPQGLFVDNHRNLWVSISGNCRTVYPSVYEFAPGGSTPEKTLSDPGGPATDVAVDDASGTVYVTNFFSGAKECTSGEPGNVEVYAAGSTTPTSTLTNSNIAYVFNDAVDKRGNLYVTYTKASGGGGIIEWTGGSGSGKDLGISLAFPAGIQTTKNGALVVCDQEAGCGDFEPGSTTMTKPFANQLGGAFGVALDKAEKIAWVEDPALSAGQLLEYRYPGPDKQPKQAISVPGSGYSGVALSPAAPQGRPY